MRNKNCSPDPARPGRGKTRRTERNGEEEEEKDGEGKEGKELLAQHSEALPNRGPRRGGARCS